MVVCGVFIVWEGLSGGVIGSYVLTSRLPTTAKGPYFAFDCKLTHFAIGDDEGEALLSGSFHFDHRLSGGNLPTAHYLGVPFMHA